MHGGQEKTLWLRKSKLLSPKDKRRQTDSVVVVVRSTTFHAGGRNNGRHLTRPISMQGRRRLGLQTTWMTWRNTKAPTMRLCTAGATFTAASLMRSKSSSCLPMLCVEIDHAPTKLVADDGKDT